MGLIVKRVDLLRSMMYRSSEVKTAAQHCELVPLVGALWSWCTVSPRLCRAVLNMLTVFTARNSEGVYTACVCLQHVCTACVYSMYIYV